MFKIALVPGMFRDEMNTTQPPMSSVDPLYHMQNVFTHKISKMVINICC